MEEALRPRTNVLPRDLPSRERTILREESSCRQFQRRRETRLVRDVSTHSLNVPRKKRREFRPTNCIAFSIRCRRNFQPRKQISSGVIREKSDGRSMARYKYFEGGKKTELPLIFHHPSIYQWAQLQTSRLTLSRSLSLSLSSLEWLSENFSAGVSIIHASVMAARPHSNQPALTPRPHPQRTIKNHRLASCIRETKRERTKDRID